MTPLETSMSAVQNVNQLRSNLLSDVNSIGSSTTQEAHSLGTIISLVCISLLKQAETRCRSKEEKCDHQYYHFKCQPAIDFHSKRVAHVG